MSQNTTPPATSEVVVRFLPRLLLFLRAHLPRLYFPELAQRRKRTDGGEKRSASFLR